MNKCDNNNKDRSPENCEGCDSKNKSKPRGKKRKRKDSESSTDIDDVLPENTLEFENSVQAAAFKNNLDDVSVKKILKKVVTNDHVLALVKLREEEEALREEVSSTMGPKITRAKYKELLKVSPKSAHPPWKAELTPIKHILVKTRPEVTALIAQELPEDEDDDEYKPTADDVPSDDDHTLESCSDVDSQPRTPATPCSQHTSPRVVRDGPFKVPQDVTPARRKLVLEEEATIARRTRSKLSLSATPIEHIESSFVPPDDIMPVVDDLWNQFLEECLNPASVSRNEEDDEADPEYNVAADPDAHDEDEEALENSIIKISKKELSDLVTELFNIMPEPASEDIPDGLLPDHTLIPSNWNGKKQTISEDETEKQAKRIMLDKDSTIVSTGKRETEDSVYADNTKTSDKDQETDGPDEQSKTKKRVEVSTTKPEPVQRKTVDITLEEQNSSVVRAPEQPPPPPPLLRVIQRPTVERVDIHVDQTVHVLPEQLQILQQQLRQHIQLAASNYLQLYVNPVHWTLAHTYKEYLEQLKKLVDSNPQSVADVCNLNPALELIDSWEKSVSDDTPENKQMVEFIQKEVDRNRQRRNQNSLYVGDFPETFMQVIANSNVFLYPYLLPSMPYGADNTRKFCYRRSEDELIVLGLDQFWSYVEANPEIFKRRTQSNPRHRWGLSASATLVCKHMMPWLSPRWLLGHIRTARKEKDSPIYDFFETRKVKPVEHKLLPFNPRLTLYEQPEHELPRIWLRYLAKSSKRFRDHLYRRTQSGLQPQGVPIDMGSAVVPPPKNPLPIDFTKTIVSTRINVLPKIPPKPLADKFDLQINMGESGNIIPVNIANINTTVNGNIQIAPRQAINTIKPTIIANIAPSMSTASTVSNTNVPGNNECKGVQMQQNPVLITPQMFQVVNTCTGAFLVPLTIVQTTACVNAPIASTTENHSTITNNVTDSEVITVEHEEIKQMDHCNCCLLIRRICKEKQTFITDFFKPKSSEEKKCDCSYRSYPKITNRLKFLVNSYKSKSWSVHKELQKRLNVVKKEKNCAEEIATRSCGSKMECDSNFSLEDMVYVTSYQLKLTIRASLIRNSYTKKKINTIFNRFDPDTGDPICLSEELYKAFEVDMVDLYKEFLGFLTAEQADKIHKFKDYFLQCCVVDLLRRIEEEVKDRESKRKILLQVKSMMVDSVSTACEMCTSLLSTMQSHPRLAKHVFLLFPHRVTSLLKTRNKDGNQKDKAPKKQNETPITATQNTEPMKETEEPTVKPSLHEERSEPLKSKECHSDNELADDDALTICDDSITFTTMDYEADHSSSGEEDGPADISLIEPDKIQSGSNDIKFEETASRNVIDTPELTISKTEVQDYCESTDMSAMVMSEDEPVKCEPPEWKRDEDKQILELLLQHVTPEQRKDKTILEIINEKNLPQIISETLTDKSIKDIKERVIYLLEILVLSEI